jgi:hypothetical protein
MAPGLSTGTAVFRSHHDPYWVEVLSADPVISISGEMLRLIMRGEALPGAELLRQGLVFAGQPRPGDLLKIYHGPAWDQVLIYRVEGYCPRDDTYLAQFPD